MGFMELIFDLIINELAVTTPYGREFHRNGLRTKKECLKQLILEVLHKGVVRARVCV